MRGCCFVVVVVVRVFSFSLAIVAAPFIKYWVWTFVFIRSVDTGESYSGSQAPLLLAYNDSGVRTISVHKRSGQIQSVVSENYFVRDTSESGCRVVVCLSVWNRPSGFCAQQNIWQIVHKQFCVSKQTLSLGLSSSCNQFNLHQTLNRSMVKRMFR